MMLVVIKTTAKYVVDNCYWLWQLPIKEEDKIPLLVIQIFLADNSQISQHQLIHFPGLCCSKQCEDGLQ